MQSYDLNIEAADIIKLMLQFCNENGLQRTVSCLSEESKVTLNTVENADTFLSDVTAGRWDSVLSSMAQLQLPRSILMDVYEQVVKEMIEMRELDLARELLRKTPACAMLKIDQPGRYLRLDQLLALSFWDPTEAYPGGATKQSRRAIIAQALAGHISSVPPSRMLALLSQALKWQQYQGTLPPGASFDLFAGEPVDTKRASDSGGRMTESNQPEMHPTQRQNQIGFGKDSYCETAAFSPDGAFMVTGSVDGFIEVYEPDTGKLRRDLDYQNNEEFMMHDDKVLCASFSRDSELLCTGSLDGKLKVWKIKTGQCVRRFEKAHGGGVTCACFGHDGTSVVTGSFDSTLRTHGLKSGKMIREFRGHASFVNAVELSPDGNKVLSGSSDGTMKIWDAKTADCLITSRPPPPPHCVSVDLTIHTVIGLPRNPDVFVVGGKCNTVFCVNIQGQTTKTMSTGKREGGDIVACTVSPRGEWVYALGEDGVCYCFSVATGKLEHLLPGVHAKDAGLGCAHHPHRGLVATWGADGNLNLWGV